MLGGSRWRNATSFLPWWRLWRSTRGAAAIEMSIIGPAFFLFVLGTLEAGRAFYTWNTMERAVEEGARYVMLYGSNLTSWGPPGNTCTTSLTACTQAWATSYMPSHPTITVSVTSTAATSTYPQIINISATCSFAFAIGSLIPGGLSPTITATAHAPIS